jgi:Fe-S oxidoreductase
MVYLPHSKHQHLVWVWFNSFFRSRRSSGRIRPMAFDEDAESFGVGTVRDFTWKQILDTQTCVECGRCSAQCPAHFTGKALDPRKLIHHIKDSFLEHLTPETGKAERRTLIGEIVSQDELWACTTCGACMNACPLDIEHVPAIIDMRRYLTMTEGDIPHELQTSLHNVEMNANPWGFDNTDRAAWAEGLGIKTMSEVDGDVEYLAETQIRDNIETMQRYKVQKIITGCPHCFNTLKNEYPDFGFAPEVIHHSEFLSELGNSGALDIKPQQPAGGVTYHDSCYLGRHNQIFDGPRQLINQATGSQPIEMPRSRKQGFCCGAGGARMWMDEREGEKINVERTREAIACGASTVATACPFCLTMIDDGKKSLDNDELRVVDIAEIVSASLPEPN